MYHRQHHLSGDLSSINISLQWYLSRGGIYQRMKSVLEVDSLETGKKSSFGL